MDEQQRIEGVSIALRDVHTRRERGQTHHTETDFVSRRRLLINLHVPIDRRSARYDQRTRDDVSPAGKYRISVLGRARGRACFSPVSNDHAQTAITNFM